MSGCGAKPGNCAPLILAALPRSRGGSLPPDMYLCVLCTVRYGFAG